MKTIYTVISLAFALLAALLITGQYSIPNKSSVYSFGDKSVYSSLGRSEWETMRLADPSTGKVPAGMRSQELLFASSLPQYSSSSLARVGAAFFSRGPVNMGGRTRAIAIDITDENIYFAGSVNGGLWRSTNAGASWTLVSSLNHNPAITSIAQDTRPGHTNIWYYSTGEAIGASAGAAGAYYLGNGVYKSTDGGVTWNVLVSTTSGTPHQFDVAYDITFRIVTDPSNLVNDVVYLACYGAIYKSINGGNTWVKERGGTSPSSYYADVAITSNGIVYGALDSDGAQKGIWRKDPVLGWFLISPPGWDTGSFNRVVMGINPSNENEVYFLGETPFMGKMTTNWKGDEEWNSLWKYTYISGNGTGAGGSWSDLSQNIPADSSQLGQFNSQGGYNLMVTVHPSDSNTVIIGGTNLFRSIDGFTSVNNTTQIGGYGLGATIPFYTNYPNHHSDQHGLVYVPSNPDKVFQSNDGGLNFTNDIRATPVVWQELNESYVTSQFYTVAIDHGTNANDVIIGGTQDNGTWFTNSSNPLIPWTHPGLGDGAHCAIDDTRQNYYMSRQEGKVGKYSLDASGNILGFRRIDPIGGSNYMFINSFILDPNNNNRMYLAGGTKIWRNDSLDIIPLTGEWDSISIGWTQLPDTIAIAGARISCMAASRTATSRLYVGTSKKSIFRIDNPESATPVMTEITDPAFDAVSYVNCIALDPNDADKIIAAFSNYNVYSLYYSIDGGTSWSKIGGNLEPGLTGVGAGPSIRWVTIAPTPNGTVYFAGTSVGLFATNNLNGVNTVWTHVATNEIGNIVVDMMDYRISDGLLAIGTHGAGMFSTNIIDTLFTKLDIIPVLESALEVFPNPILSDFNLSYVLKKSIDVKIRLFDLKGTEVKQINGGIQQAGKHELRISSEGLNEGIYFLKLESGGDLIGAKKLMILGKI